MGKFLICIFAATFLSLNAVASEGSERVIHFAFEEEVGCATTSLSRILCWSNKNSVKELIFANPELLEPPQNVKGPNEIVMNIFTACVTSDDGIRCWGSNSKAIEAKTKAWKNPRKLSIYFHTVTGRLKDYESDVCAVTDDGTLCSSAVGPEIPDHSPTPDQIFPNLYSGMCILDEGELRCPKAMTADSVNNIPASMKNVSLAAFSKLGACGLSQISGLGCWGLGFNPQKDRFGFLVPPNLKVDAIDMALNSEELCLVTREKSLMCWGVSYHNVSYVPNRVDSVLKVKLSGTNKCILNVDQKLACWNVYGDRPHLDFKLPSEIAI